MTKYHVLAKYPRRRAVLIGAFELPHDSWLDSNNDACAYVMHLVQTCSSTVCTPNGYDEIQLSNGVILYIDPSPADPLESWVERASKYPAS